MRTLTHTHRDGCARNSGGGISSSSLRNRVILSLLLAVAAAASAASTDGEPAVTPSAAENCTHPAIEEFPPDFITPEQRKKGGIAAHIIIALYLIVALGMICDDYFVPVLEIICDALNLKPDVAGATFMAAGES